MEMKLDDCNAPYTQANQPATMESYKNNELDSTERAITFFWVFVALHIVSAVWHGFRTIVMGF